jgi:hypothetical protein
MISNSLDYCVIFDEGGWPASLADVEDLERAVKTGVARLLDPRATLPPAILAPETAVAEELAAHPTVTLLEFGARGGIVMSGRIVKGIIPASLVLNALQSGGLPPSGRAMGVSLGDVQLGGSLNTPVGRFVCRACGYLNEVEYLDRDNLPPCQNPQPPKHPLKVY